MSSSKLTIVDYGMAIFVRRKRHEILDAENNYSATQRCLVNLTASYWPWVGSFKGYGDSLIQILTKP